MCRNSRSHFGLHSSRSSKAHFVPPKAPEQQAAPETSRRTAFSPTREVVQMNRKGFTLIELLIEVVIIGILAAIAITKFANTKEKAYLASMKSDLRNLITAEEAYFADSVKYTSNLGTAYNVTSGVVGPTIAVTANGLDRKSVV